jgi:hypothetical protein
MAGFFAGEAFIAVAAAAFIGFPVLCEKLI